MFKALTISGLLLSFYPLPPYVSLTSVYVILLLLFLFYPFLLDGRYVALFDESDIA